MSLTARIICSLFLLFLFLTFPQKASATSVVINEIYNPTNSDWVELYNPTDSPINIGGWEIWDIKTSGGEQKSKTINNEITINAKGFYAIDVSNKLNKDGDTVFLKNGNDVVDSHSYSINPGEGTCFGRKSDGGSWHKLNPCTKGRSNNNSSIITPSPSPSPTSSPSPSPTDNPSKNISNILLNEIMACPDEDNEWVELFNNNDSGVDLVDWLIRDSTTKSKDFSTHIGSKGYARIEIDSHFLNNDGDNVRLMVEDEQKDSMSYSSCSKGYSWSKIGGSWCQTEDSPQQANKSCIASEENDSSSSPSPTTQTTTTTTTTTKTPSSLYKKESASSKEMLLNDQEIEIGEVLGATESGEEGKEEEEEDEEEKPFIMPFIISGAGLLMLAAASFPFLKPKIVEFIKQRKLKIKYQKPKTHI